MNLQVGVKVLIEKNGRYLFLRRNQAFKPGPQKWDIPGGRIEPDELLREALAREVREETHLSLGASLELLSAQDIFAPDKDLHVVRLTYRTSLDDDKGDVEISDEHDDYKWMTINDILTEEHVDSYLREVVKQLFE